MDGVVLVGGEVWGVAIGGEAVGCGGGCRTIAGGSGDDAIGDVAGVGCALGAFGNLGVTVTGIVLNGVGCATARAIVQSY